MGFMDFFKGKKGEPVQAKMVRVGANDTHEPDTEAWKERTEEHELRRELQSRETHERARYELERKGKVLTEEEKEKGQDKQEKDLFAGFKNREPREMTHDRTR